MEEMEPVVRVGLVTGGLAAGGLETVVVAGGFMLPAMLCLAAGAFFTPSETEARGRVAVADDLTEATEPTGETTARTAEAGFEAVDDPGLAEVEEDNGFEVDEASGGLGTVVAVGDLEAEGAGALGAIEVRRAGPVADVPVDGALEIGPGFTGERGTPALTDFFSAVVADETLLAAEVAAGVTTLAAGAFFKFPAPNVPELRICAR